MILDYYEEKKTVVNFDLYDIKQTIFTRFYKEPLNKTIVCYNTTVFYCNKEILRYDQPMINMDLLSTIIQRLKKIKR